MAWRPGIWWSISERSDESDAFEARQWIRGQQGIAYSDGA